jgi:hypothetical protein
MDDDYGPFIAAYEDQKTAGVIADFGLIHELSHHLPVGDNYVYNMGRGHGIRVPQPGGKTAVFDWDKVIFMENDHMTGPSSMSLSAPAAYEILEFWERNPMQRRPMQWGDAFGATQHIYGSFFYSTLTIRISGLDAAGITGCDFAREEPVDGIPADIELQVSLSGERQSISYSSGTCELVLTRAQQEAAFPGGYVLLKRGDFHFPFYVGRNIVEMLYWADGSGSSKTLQLQATAELGAAMDSLASDLAAGGQTVRMNRSLVANALLPWEDSAEYLLVGDLDSLGNRYAMDLR